MFSSRIWAAWCMKSCRASSVSQSGCLCADGWSPLHCWLHHEWSGPRVQRASLYFLKADAVAFWRVVPNTTPLPRPVKAASPPGNNNRRAAGRWFLHMIMQEVATPASLSAVRWLSLMRWHYQCAPCLFVRPVDPSAFTLARAIRRRPSPRRPLWCVLSASSFSPITHMDVWNGDKIPGLRLPAPPRLLMRTGDGNQRWLLNIQLWWLHSFILWFRFEKMLQ